MLIKIGNLIIDLDQIVLADISYPTEDGVDEWIELAITFANGASTCITGDQAEQIWKLLCADSVALVHPDPLNDSIERAIA